MCSACCARTTSMTAIMMSVATKFYLLVAFIEPRSIYQTEYANFSLHYFAISFSPAIIFLLQYQYVNINRWSGSIKREKFKFQYHTISKNIQTLNGKMHYLPLFYSTFWKSNDFFILKKFIAGTSNGIDVAVRMRIMEFPNRRCVDVMVGVEPSNNGCEIDIQPIFWSVSVGHNSRVKRVKCIEWYIRSNELLAQTIYTHKKKITFSRIVLQHLIDHLWAVTIDMKISRLQNN